MSETTDVLSKEFTATFDMIRQAIEPMDNEFWKENENDWNYGYIVFHTIEAIDFYLGDSAETWQPMTSISANSRMVETESLQAETKAYFTAYLDAVEERFEREIKSKPSIWFAANDGFAPRGFLSRSHKFSYVLRHCMLHLGELTKSLRARKMDRIKWM